MKKIGGIAISMLLAVSLAGCGTSSNQSADNPNSSDTVQSSNQMPAPVIMSTTELAGKEVSITKERPLVITSDDPTTWTGSVTDASIAVFNAGEKTDSAEFNFGFSALRSGTTEATISDGTTNIEFTINVE